VQKLFSADLLDGVHRRSERGSLRAGGEKENEKEPRSADRGHALTNGPFA
jgi:hypothetical protein